MLEMRPIQISRQALSFRGSRVLVSEARLGGLGRGRILKRRVKKMWRKTPGRNAGEDAGVALMQCSRLRLPPRGSLQGHVAGLL